VLVEEPDRRTRRYGCELSCLGDHLFGGLHFLKASLGKLPK
jgi:hypothetical protein